MQSINESEFIKEALSQDLRIDGRNLKEYRNLQYQIYNQDNQITAELSLGGTFVIAKSSVEVKKTLSFKPFEGILNFQVLFMPMADPNFEDILGPVLDIQKNQSSTDLSKQLQKSIKSMISLEQICISPYNYCFQVNVTITIAINKGNLLDAACLASVIALKNLQLPVYQIEKIDKNQQVVINLIKTDKFKQIAIRQYPIIITFGVYEQKLFVDPCLQEEKICQGKISICCNQCGDILYMRKIGKTVRPDEILQISQLALEISALQYSKINKLT